MTRFGALAGPFNQRTLPCVCIVSCTPLKQRLYGSCQVLASRVFFTWGLCFQRLRVACLPRARSAWQDARLATAVAKYFLVSRGARTLHVPLLHTPGKTNLKGRLMFIPLSPKAVYSGLKTREAKGYDSTLRWWAEEAEDVALLSDQCHGNWQSCGLTTVEGPAQFGHSAARFPADAPPFP